MFKLLIKHKILFFAFIFLWIKSRLLFNFYRTTYNNALYYVQQIPYIRVCADAHFLHYRSTSFKEPYQRSFAKLRFFLSQCYID